MSTTGTPAANDPATTAAQRYDPRRVWRLYARLLRLARGEWPALAAGLFFLVLGSAMGLAYPQAIRVIIDQAVQEGGLADVDRAGLAMLLIFLVQGGATAVRHYLFATAGERVVVQLRQELYRRVIGQEIAFFDATRTGDLTSRLSVDSAALQGAVTTNLSMGLRSGAAVLGGVALLFYTSTPLATLMLLVVPPAVIASLLFGRRIRRLARQFHDALGRANEVAEETLSGIRTVRAFAREADEARRYGGAVHEAFVAARQRIVSAAWYSGAMSFVGYGVVALVLWTGGRLVLRQEMSVGDLTSFILYTLIVAFSLAELGWIYAELMRAAGAGERVFELLERTSAIERDGGQTLPAVRGRVDFEAVRFAYPSRPEVTVLDDLALHLAPGEVVALVGPSGAGKSTIANLLCRFYDPNAGVIRLDGADLRTLRATWLREQIGVVAQDPLLLSTTIAANIRYGKLDATDAEVEAAARLANAHEFVAALPDAYQTLVGERGIQLSGGQRQRLAIARAVLKDPRLLILDEATSALDAESEHLVREAVARLLERRTTLIIAHRLSTVQGADRVVVLSGGRVVQSGSHHELMQAERGLYRRLVERQFIAA